MTVCPLKAPQELDNRIYRVIRACQDTFSAEEIASLAECGLNKIRLTFRALENQGYIKVAGQRGPVKLWRMTPLGRNSPIAPERPKNREDFTAERRALTCLVEIFLGKELSNGRVADSVKAQLDILNRRFGGAEKGGER